MEQRCIETPSGPARVHIRTAGSQRALLVLGHGAGGSLESPDIAAVSDAAAALDVTVALVAQPYVVAGRRVPAPARQLDEAWITVVRHLKSHAGDVRLIAGGRSMGSRVACRTATATGAVGVLCLAFPLQPRRRASGTLPATRLPELDGVGVPTLVIQGQRDPFGIPPPGPCRRVEIVPGGHGPTQDLQALTAIATQWMTDLLDT